MLINHLWLSFGPLYKVCLFQNQHGSLSLFVIFILLRENLYKNNQKIQKGIPILDTLHGSAFGPPFCAWGRTL